MKGPSKNNWLIYDINDQNIKWSTKSSVLKRKQINYVEPFNNNNNSIYILHLYINQNKSILINPETNGQWPRDQWIIQIHVLINVNQY